MTNKELLDVWWKLYEIHGRSPTIRALSKATGLSTSTVMHHLLRAAEIGKLIHRPNMTPSFVPARPHQQSMPISLPWDALVLVEQHHPDVMSAYVARYLLRKEDAKKPSAKTISTEGSGEGG